MAYLGTLADWLDKIKGSFKNATISGTTITLTKNDDTTVTLVTQDTVYSVATSSADGLMSSTDKAAWDALQTILSGGTEGQVLSKTSSGYAWADLANLDVNPTGV